ncbi:MAG: MmcQ/YjbR family DNA-binding protein [Verrucomicrobiota bacterium]|nr:MmcQ/YjbR family DNA-binding protein [Verrucomicrobiota bacterium]
MNKKHWNSVIIAGSVPDAEISRMIDDSYDLVFRSLTKAERARIAPAAG